MDQQIEEGEIKTKLGKIRTGIKQLKSVIWDKHIVLNIRRQKNIQINDKERINIL